MSVKTIYIYNFKCHNKIFHVLPNMTWRSLKQNVDPIHNEYKTIIYCNDKKIKYKDSEIVNLANGVKLHLLFIETCHQCRKPIISYIR